MEILGFVASIVMGLTLGMIGGGGSILTVPILVYLFKLDPIIATAYSLFIVGSTALAGGLFYLKRGEVDLKTGFIFAIPSFFGVYLTRSYIVRNLPDPVFQIGSLIFPKALLIMLVFAIIMLTASISMIKSKSTEIKKSELNPITKWVLIGLEGLLVGAVTGFVGAGGGFLIVPSLVILVGLPMKIAIGTSLFIIAANSLIGILGELQHHVYFDWKLVITMASIAIVGLFFGIYLSKKVSEKNLKKGFGYFVLIMGSIILIDQLTKL